MEENIITLIDEDGKEVEFEMFNFRSRRERIRYIITIRWRILWRWWRCSYYVFRIDSDENGDILVPLEDEEEYQIVVDVYNTLMDEEGLNDDQF